MYICTIPRRRVHSHPKPPQSPPAPTRTHHPVSDRKSGPSMSRTVRSVLLALAVAAAGVAALGARDPAEAQKRGGTLTIVRPTDPVSLDPNLETTAPGAWVYFHMLEGLLTLDENMQIKPALATSWDVISPTRVRFKLRPNVRFHDGTPFNAAAVKFTFDRLLDPKTIVPIRFIVAAIKQTDVVDPYTVRFTLSKPDPVLSKVPWLGWSDDDDRDADVDLSAALINTNADVGQVRQFIAQNVGQQEKQMEKLRRSVSYAEVTVSEHKVTTDEKTGEGEAAEEASRPHFVKGTHNAPAREDHACAEDEAAEDV